MITGPTRTQRRATFILYALTLFVLTHWPNLAVEHDLGRPDLVIHFVAFGLWTLLLAACAFFGDVLSRRNVLLSMLVTVAYACVDEGLQLLPIVSRHASWDDLAANVGGVAIAGTLLLLLGIPFHRKPSE